MWNFPLFPPSASTTSGKVDAVFFGGMIIVVAFTALICTLILFLSARYRRGTRADRSRPPLTSFALEAAWIGVPLILSIGLFFWAAVVFFELYSPPGDASDIYVVGRQWMWTLKHPEGHREKNELHLPVGRPVKLTMTSEDVIHSFYIPAFRTKQDVLPGRYTTMWFNPTKPGKYHLFCAEYCGTDHSRMVGSVYVMEPADYQRWLAGPGGSDVTPSMAKEGEQLFVQHHCAGCHRGSQVVHAPRLEGVYNRPVPIQVGDRTHFVTADARYLRDSILLPDAQVVAGYQPIMPSFKDRISEEDLLKIIEYIKSIGTEGGD